MPPLVVLPVASPSPPASIQSVDQAGNKGQAPLKPRLDSVSPDEGPLLYKLSDEAPRNARIIAREITDSGAFYTLQIGDVQIPEVALYEILDYVSPEQLESYEFRQFEEEAEVERVAKEEEERLEAERLQRRRERAMMYGSGSEGPKVPTGKHGRARPTYQHMFKKVKVRRRRKRNPITGELMPLSDDEDDEDQLDSSGLDQPYVRQPPAAYEQLPDAPQRRRRKRDPITGELMPLEPVGTKKKRPRRRRHPITGELMPLGWHYVPDAPSEAATAVGNMSPAMKRLSISHDNGAKRMKLAHDTSTETSDAMIAEEASVSGSDADDTDEQATPRQKFSGLKSPPSARRSLLSTSSALQASPKPSASHVSPRKSTMTSIMQPFAATRSVEPSEEEEEEDDDGVDGEYAIEAILAHKLSDPKTHPPAFGKEPVMLYQVRWEGYAELTWEPIESFPDRSVVEDYRKLLKSRGTSITRHSSDDEEKGEDEEQEVIHAASAPTPARNRASSSKPEDPMHVDQSSEEGDDDEDEDEDDDEGFDVEAITGHHMSDPRTHPPDLGKNPVMLYRVKWKGFQDPTWEPIESFLDRDVVQQYRKEVGLPEL
jgi:hypothetical protein